MKWFKHDSNARHDAKLAKLRNKYGLEGYGLYFYLLECIAGTVEAHNLTFELEEDAELISASTNIHIERIEEMMRYMVGLGLFEMGDSGAITCLKMSLRTDEYTQKLIKRVTNVPTLSRQNPDKLPIMSDLIEEKEENRTDNKTRKRVSYSKEFSEFWDLYPRKIAKGNADKAWLKAVKAAKPEDIITGLKKQLPVLKTKEADFIPHAATWLNGCRWEDEVATTTVAAAKPWMTGNFK